MQYFSICDNGSAILFEMETICHLMRNEPMTERGQQSTDLRFSFYPFEKLNQKRYLR